MDPGSPLRGPVPAGGRRCPDSRARLMLRGAGNGTFTESIDLDADFRRTFGTSPGVLLGLGISADSDNTNGVIEGEPGDLVLE